MNAILKNLRHSLRLKLTLFVGTTILCSILFWAMFTIRYQKQNIMANIIQNTERLSTTIKLGTHYAMMLNSRDDINQIINNISRQKDIQNIRIYNKAGQIKFSNDPAEVDQYTNIKAEACDVCHRSDPPKISVDIAQRMRIFDTRSGTRSLGLITSIHNEPNCSTDACHVHPKNKKILGALDVVVSLEQTDHEILQLQAGIFGLAGILFLVTTFVIFLIVLKFVNKPIEKLIHSTQKIARGEYDITFKMNPDDEIGQLATAIKDMSDEIALKQNQLNTQREEYQSLFELVPCLITVQNKNFQILRYNREFAEKFDPTPDAYCYTAYKGYGSKCNDCPVEMTFADGKSHLSEQAGINKDGSASYWITKTSPIKNEQGEVIAAMEMSLDISDRKDLEKKLEMSEKKYHDIFKNIPNPVFVLDLKTLEILDCNENVKTVYGHDKPDLCTRSFLTLFNSAESNLYERELKTQDTIDRVEQIHKNGHPLKVNIRISRSQYTDREVLLVTISDITKRLETEQQLMQASKMATLGEMATGVAHELNQPLSVMKTASTFFIQKIADHEKIDESTLHVMLKKIDSNVDRATKIINHMRQFARKSDITLQPVQIRDVIEKTLEIFNQQLKLREIQVICDIDQGLPKIMADPVRLEQVFINLLINARDAIEEKWQNNPCQAGDKQIEITAQVKHRHIMIQIKDTGAGIPKHVSEKVFEPFFTTKEVGKGTGLGLSISYGIIKECHGEISVDKYYKDGACFNIIFPIPSPEELSDVR